jgi:hypothetical protein
MRALSLKTTTPWTTLALTVVAVVSLLLVTNEPDFENALLVFIITGIVIAMPLILGGLKNLPWLQLATVTTLFMLFDDPTGNPFYEITPVTEKLGQLLFIPMWRHTAVPLPFSLIEIFAFYVACRVLWRHFKTEKSLREPVFTNANGIALAIIAFIGVYLCLIRGNDLDDAIFQCRRLPLYALVGIAARHFIKTEDDLWNFIVIIAICAVIKALQGTYIWFTDIQGGAIERRYLIDHYYSDALIHAVLVLVGSVLIPSRRPLIIRLAWRVACVIPVCAALYLNNRRTAYIGLAFSMVFIPFFVAPSTMRRFLPKILITLSAAMLMFGILVVRKFTGSDGTVYIRDLSALYRVNENLNLLENVRYFPFLGSGLGVMMPNTHALASITAYYEEFRLIPHNTMLFVWSFLGPVGITLFAFYCSGGIASGLGLAEGLHSSNPRVNIRSKIIGFVVLSQVVRWLLYVYADMGLFELRFILIVPTMIAGATIILNKRDKERQLAAESNLVSLTGRPNGLD